MDLAKSVNPRIEEALNKSPLPLKGGEGEGEG